MAHDIGDPKLISLLSGKTEVGEKNTLPIWAIVTTTAIFANSLSVEAVHFTAAQSVKIMTGMHRLDASSVLQEIQAVSIGCILWRSWFNPPEVV